MARRRTLGVLRAIGFRPRQVVAVVLLEHGLLAAVGVALGWVVGSLLAPGLGDIGEHFPDTDERWRDADSLCLLADVLAEVAGAGMAVVNVDCTIVMETPKLGPYKQAIRTCLGGALGLPQERVNIKASTGEGIGFVGRGEGVAALAIVSLDGG